MMFKKIAIAFVAALAFATASFAQQQQYLAPYAGAQARTQNDKASDVVSALDFIPQSLRAAIKAGTSTTDVSSYLTTLHSQAPSGAPVLFPPGQYRLDSNVTMTGRVLNIQGATFTGSGVLTGAGSLVAGPTTPVLGTSLASDMIWRTNAADQTELVNLGGIWPAGTVSSGLSIVKSFGGGAGGPGDAPLTGAFIFARNTGTDADAPVDGLISMVRVESSSRRGFAANLIATSTAVTSPEMTGLEVDCMADASATTPTCSAILANAFNHPNLGTVIQTGAAGGGTWANVLAIGGVASNGGGIFPLDSQTAMAFMLDTDNPAHTISYSTAAVMLGNQHRLLFKDSGGGTSPAFQLRSNSANESEYIAGGGNLHLFLQSDGTTRIFALSSSAVTAYKPITYVGSSSGAVTTQVQAAAGTYNFNLPTTAGSSGQVLTSAGGGSSPMTWTSLGTSATVNTGTSGGTIPLLNTAVTFSGGSGSTAAIVASTANGNGNIKLSRTGSLTGTGCLYANGVNAFGVTDGACDAAGDVFSVTQTSGNGTFKGGVTVGSTTLLTSSVALTNGAAGNTGTLTNAPAAGNPTKWLAVNDNGTTRYIPAW